VTDTYAAIYIGKSDEIKKITGLSASGSVTITADEKKSISSSMKKSHTFSENNYSCSMMYYQPIEADSYTDNYRFGGNSGIKVVGAFGASSSATDTVTAWPMLKNATAAADISGAVAMAASATAALAALLAF